MNQLLMALCVCSADLLGCPHCNQSGYQGHDGMGGDMSFTLINRNDPCYRGTMFNALKVLRAYRDNEAFAFHHFEGKRLTISGRLVRVRRDAVNYVLVDDKGVPLVPGAVPGVAAP